MKEIEIILKKARHILRNAKRNYEYDIPYLAGYSNDGKTLYVDRHVPTTIPYKGKCFDFHKFLLWHEATEKSALMLYKIKYHSAHLLASKVEHEKVISAGLPWNVYKKYTRKWIKTAGHENLNRVPKNLDLLPYRAFKSKDDIALLKQMKSLMLRQ
jgi:hypothetical protein